MLRQMKLTNGEEIICKIIQGAEEGSDEILVQNCLKLTRMEMAKNVSYHSFRPWMIMKDEVTDIVSVNSYHIVAMCIPGEEMKRQYKSAIKELKEVAAEREHYSLEEWYNKLEAAEESFEDALNDSDGRKVISLSDYNKDKLH